MSTSSSSQRPSLVAILLLILLHVAITQQQRRQRYRYGHGRQYCPPTCQCTPSLVRCRRLQALNYMRYRPGIIDLRYNSIRSLPARHFDQFFNLSSLLLDHNDIRVIAEHSFTGLQELQYLYLYENRIRTIHKRSFRGLTNLKQLYLHANEIHAISPGTFWPLVNLERLFISNNRLETLPSRLLSRLSSITKIQLGGNPLKCDCNLAWLSEYVRQHEEVNVLATCLNPREYANYAIKDVPTSAFTCGGSSDVAPEIEVEPEDAEVSQGHIVRLNCQATGSPTPRITWNHDGETVEVNTRIRILVDGTLLIQSARQSDEGEYRCVASNSLAARESRTVRLRYNGPNGRPQFIESPQNVVVHAGQEVTVTCRTSGTPAPVIQWYRNRERFPPSGDPSYVVTPSGNLLFRRISLSDNGTYTCMAANSVGSIDASALVIVRNPPRFTATPRDQTAARGSAVTLECAATGNPQPRIVWLRRDGSELEPTARHIIMSSGSLLIRSVDESDEGLYTCRATSSYGHLDQTATLRVAIPPSFVVRPQNQRVRQETHVDFHCQVSGRPQPHIVWTVNDRAVPDDPRYSLLASGTLRLIRAKPYDSGVYKCEAANSVGQVETQVSLQVVPTVPLSFVRSLADQEVDAGQDVRIACEIRSEDGSGRDLYVVWVKDDVRIIPTAGGRFSITHPPTSVLTIRSVGQSDRGRYECRVRSENDAISSSMTLNVRVRSSTEQILSTLADVLPPGCLEEGCSPEENDDQTVLDAFFYEGEVENFRRNHRRFKRQTGVLTIDSLNRVMENSHSAVNRAINHTISHFNNRRNRQTAGDLLSLMRFPATRQGIDMAKAAEVFDVSLQVIECCVRRGRRGVPDERVDFADITDGTDDVQNEEPDVTSLIGPEVIELVANLSGCSTYRTKPNCSEDFCYHRKYRTIDGTCNNLQHPMWGASLTPFHRILQPIYENGFNAPIAWSPNRTYNGHPLPSPRSVSFGVLMSGGDMGRSARADEQFTHMVMQWGQFLDHDLDFTTMAPSIQRFSDGLACKDSCDRQAPCFPINVDANDPRHGRFHHHHHHHHHQRQRQRNNNDKSCMEFTRSSAVCGSGITSVFFNILSRREQINQITSYMDASNVYGSTVEEASNLRDLSEDLGLLKEGQALENGQKPLLPYNVYSDLGPEATVIRPVAPIECRRGDSETARQRSVPCFLAGDLRCNEQVALTSMHTIWMREHNRIARYLKKVNPQWGGDTVYSETRKIVGAQMQHITYHHWLPKLLGPFMDQIGAYGGYNPNQPSSIVNVFATAAYRFGHTMINPILYRLNASWHEHEHGHLQLHQAFFAPFRIVHEGGIEPLIRGLIAKPMKKRDTDSSMNAELIERLFELTESVALDLGALNVQRGRDHALPFYNDWRQFCNLTVARRFDDLAAEIRSADVRAKLAELYGTPANIDPFVGMIVEDVVAGSKLGPTLGCLLSEQFKRTRDGDRFWYENPGIFSPQQVTALRQASLARVICDNTDGISTVPRDVFALQPVADFVSCEDVPSVDLSAWVECKGHCSSGEDEEEEQESSSTLSGHVRSFSRRRRDLEDGRATEEATLTAEKEKDEVKSDVEAAADVVQSLVGVIEQLRAQLESVEREVSALKASHHSEEADEDM